MNEHEPTARPLEYLLPPNHATVFLRICDHGRADLFLGGMRIMNDTGPQNKSLLEETIGMSREQKEVYLIKRIDSLNMRIKALETQLKIVNKKRG